MCAGDETCEALRPTIDAVAEAEAVQLVAEAWQDARSQARTILTKVLTQALVERSGAQLARLADQPSGRDGHRQESQDVAERSGTRPDGRWPRRTSVVPPSSDPCESTGLSGVLGYYVYGVVGDMGLQLPGSLSGVAESHHAHVVVAGDLAAVVSQVPLSADEEQVLRNNFNDPNWIERIARTHDRVLDEVRVRTTVIPMRLCTIHRSESSVREMLVRDRQAFAQALSRLRGKTEWGLKIFVDRDLLARAAREGDHELAKLGAELAGASRGAAYMRSKQFEGRLQDATDRLVDESVEDVHGRLSALAVETRFNPLQRQEVSGHCNPMVLNNAYLLEDSVTQDFHACVATLRAKYDSRGCDLQATGPWPPYNFVDSSTHTAP